jgi:hypothetical protein
MRPLAIVGAFFGLFLAGAAAGAGLAGLLAPGSSLAEAVSCFALPVAFAAGLQAWYGLALFGMILRLLRMAIRAGAPVPGDRQAARARLPGSFVFLPLSSGAGILAGIVAGLVSSAYPAWFIVLVYGLVGTVHGLLAWRLAHAGVLLPPDSV